MGQHFYSAFIPDERSFLWGGALGYGPSINHFQADIILMASDPANTSATLWVSVCFPPYRVKTMFHDLFPDLIPQQVDIVLVVHFRR